MVDDSSGTQRLQITLLADESKDNVEHFQEYGFTSNPKPGAEVITVSVGGDRGHSVVLVCHDKRYRMPGLASGEVAMYTDEESYVALKRNKEMHASLSKFKIQNEANEFVDVLSQLVQAIIDARTFTALGPEPLLNETNPFPVIKSKLDSFKI